MGESRLRGAVVGALLAVAIMAAPLRAHASGDTDASRWSAATNRSAPVEHKALSLGIVGGTYGFLWGFTYLAWYLNSEGAPSFHTADEGWFGMDTYAGGADKMGHLWGNYAVVRGVSGILAWGGWSKEVSLLTATGLTLGLFTTTELEDGYREEYGFSWNDMAMNVTGEVFAVLMETSPWLDRRFDFRLEYWPSKPFRQSAAEDGPFNSPEDYTGQRFLLAYHLATIGPLRESSVLCWTKYLDLSLGFQAAHFKPEDHDTNAHAQDLFAGISVNVQQILDDTIMTGRGPRGAGTRAIGFVNEIYQPPYTTLRVGGVGRTDPSSAR